MACWQRRAEIRASGTPWQPLALRGPKSSGHRLLRLSSSDSFSRSTNIYWSPSLGQERRRLQESQPQNSWGVLWNILLPYLPHRFHFHSTFTEQWQSGPRLSLETQYQARRMWSLTVVKESAREASQHCAAAIIYSRAEAGVKILCVCVCGRGQGKAVHWVPKINCGYTVD